MKGFVDKVRASFWNDPFLHLMAAVLLTGMFVREFVKESNDKWGFVYLAAAAALFYFAIRGIVTTAQQPGEAAEVESDAVDWQRKAEEAARAGNTIAAIRYVRAGTGMGFKEAKNYVEAKF
jgi:ribosomal protein L7/L12